MANTIKMVAAGAFMALATMNADADPQVCRQLEAQLASPSTSAQVEKYDRAVQQQLDELMRLEARADRAGCFGGWRDVLGRRGDNCPAMLGTLERMERNLGHLERTRDQFARRGGSGRERARILAAMDANGCGAVEPRRLPPPITAEEESRPFFDDAQPANGMLRIGPNLPGTYRTLCVRTCDGYYFPISFATTSDMFGRDEQACRAQCPGTDVQLYFHRSPGEESEQMVSMAGVPYTELPNAFKYRQASYSRPQGCSCQAADKSFSVVGGGTEKSKEPGSTSGEIQAGSIIPIPAPGTDPEQDNAAAVEQESETAHEDAAVSSNPESASAEKPAVPETAAGGDRRVRVVGPTFLPDQEEAIDLRSRGRTAIR